MVWLVPAEVALPTPPAWLVSVYVVDDWAIILVAPVAWHLTHCWGAEVVRVTLDPMRRRFTDAEVAVAESVAPGIVVRADREKLRQVLANLVDNALDAVAAVPVADRRVVIAVATANGTARLEVRDSGPGIPDAARAHVFEPFFSQKPTGTGLGLAIARRTVEAHGGRIATEPVTPHGTIFRVDLPTRA